MPTGVRYHVNVLKGKILLCGGQQNCDTGITRGSRSFSFTGGRDHLASKEFREIMRASFLAESEEGCGNKSPRTRMRTVNGALSWGSRG
ncbi:hypothetical protein AVEN_80563-1 [Araneus ventricosus]|uniref:Uncharacterized protein n=1 Tax=Araneus ventricosus TaxID=182803 RepID=A0A4Y2CNI0_ARAVE|nr:hypothetical protein AVEN_80563-1 [Araneus ventricosus]